MNKDQRVIFENFKIDCELMDSSQIIQIASEVIGWVSRRDRCLEEKGEEDRRTGLEQAYGLKADH